MDPERWQRIQELYHSAVKLDPERRAGYLRAQCGGDQALLLTLESLFENRLPDDSLLEVPAFELAARDMAGDADSDQPARNSLIGSVVANYKIMEQIGAGGMGVVYKALDLKLRRQVALKFLPEALACDPAAVERFRREAHAVSALNHPNILTVYEFGSSGDLRYVVTEFVEGKSLRESIGKLSTEEALDYARQIGQALEAAHKVGIVHRDIKPENVMIRPDGYVKVLDFGLAKFTNFELQIKSDDSGASSYDRSPAITVITSPGVLIGTVPYMSPEQVRHEPLDQRTDIWSWGVVLHEMLTGRHPFEAPTPVDVLAAIVHNQPAPPTNEPEINDLVAKALSKRVDERYLKVEFALQDLRHAASVAQGLVPSPLRSSASKPPQSGLGPVGNPEARLFYLKAMHQASRWTPEGLRKSVEICRQALEADPLDPLPYVALAYTYIVLAQFKSADQVFPLAKAAALRALELDETIAEAHAILGHVLLVFDWSFKEAKKHLLRGIELGPNMPSVHLAYGFWLLATGNIQEAMAQAKAALKLDNLMGQSHMLYGRILYCDHQFEAAAEELACVLDLRPGLAFARRDLSFAYARAGKWNEAVREAQEIMKAEDETTDPGGYLAALTAVAGRKDEAHKRLAELVPRPSGDSHRPFWLSISYSALGESDSAFQSLELCYVLHSAFLPFIRTDPDFGNLRSDPRFDELCRRIGVLEAFATKKILPKPDATTPSGKRNLADFGPKPEAESRQSISTVPATPGHQKWNPWLGVGVALIVLGTVAWSVYRYLVPKPSPFQRIEITQVTGNGKVKTATISPDGRYIGYAVDEGSANPFVGLGGGGKESLWVRQAPGGNDVQVAPAADVSYKQLTFSHDGESLYAIRSEREHSTGFLCKIPILRGTEKRILADLDCKIPIPGGTEKRILADLDDVVAFSPDGKKMALLRFLEAGHSNLVIANEDGSGERILADCKSPSFVCVNGVAWSPNGRSIATNAFWGESGTGRMSPLEFSVQSGAEHFPTNKRWAWVGNLAWLPDGQGLIVNAMDLTSTHYQITFLSQPDGQLRRITTDTNEYSGVSLTADSRTLATVQQKFAFDAWVTSVGNAASTKPITSGGNSGETTWGANRTIVFQKIMGQGEMNIWIMESDGSNAKQLTTNAGRLNILPRVSPDGRYIVFASERTGTAHFWRMDIDGNNPKQLTHSSEDYPWFGLDFTPDSKWVVYARTGADGGLWKVSIEGGEPTRLNTSRLAYYPAVSPDGTMLAYYNEDSPEGIGVEVMSLGGNPTRRFDIGKGTIRWTPDSRSLLYVKNKGGVSNLWRQPISGQRPKQITHFNNLLIANFDLSRDGKELVMSRGTANRDVVLIHDLK